MRRTTLFCWGLAGLLGLLLIADQLRGQSVSLGSLLDEMIDRDNLARFPAAGVHVQPGQQLRPWHGGTGQTRMVRQHGSQLLRADGGKGRAQRICVDGCRGAGVSRSDVGHLAWSRRQEISRMVLYASIWIDNRRTGD